MFVHLDLGWMAHPFPLSSFRLTQPEQIAVIRHLGLKRVRWSPERSVLPDGGPWPAGGAAAGAGGAAGDQAAPSPGAAGEAAMPDATESAAAAAAASAPGAGAVAPDVAPDPWAEEQARARLCERQQQEACRAWRLLADQVLGQPDQARETAAALSRSLVDKLLPAGDVCVRVLAEPRGDRASAHALNVAVLSLLLGRQLGLAPDLQQELGLGSLLHDIGKLNLPDRVRWPREDFSAAELSLYRDHVGQGVQLGRRMSLPPGALLVLGQHHETADGRGFPLGVKQAQMNRLASIVALVNAYDNLCNPASLARALTPHEALSRLFSQHRRQHDEAVMGGLVRLLGIYPPGTVVELSDGRPGLVLRVNGHHPMRPQLRVHDLSQPDGGLWLDLARHPALSVRGSLRPEQLGLQARQALEPRQRTAYFFEMAAPDEALAESADAPTPQGAR
ncbi:DUF3391 domain-containing protein [Ideonella sp. TBM-1]|uniref:DUF3391 domain-containing protein n=2 Tax=Ideonella livida TaxID=2707176 RepID=A0A7C9PHA6_9BURK|nr:DUF3391 domain-containing protein [Ideonella livida]